MSSLFIIGNGFDLAHGLPTKYSNFRSFLEKEYEADEDIILFPPEITMGNHGEEDPNSAEVASLVTHLLLNANVGKDWCDFEEKLGQLDYDEFYDHIEDFSSDEEENFFITAYKMEDVTSSLLKSIPYIQELFREWIDTILINPKLLQRQPFKSLCVPEKDAFLNFNYTLTLEKLYNCKNVCHIHGKQGQSILVGHGDDTDEAGCFDNTQFPGAICNLTDVKRALRKDTNNALQNNHKFFESLSTVDKIYSIGFSFNSVDMVYIQEICRQIDSDKVVWTFNNHGLDEKELESIKNSIRKYGYTGKFEIKKII